MTVSVTPMPDGAQHPGDPTPEPLADAERTAPLLAVVRGCADLRTGSDALAAALETAGLAGTIDDRAALLLAPIGIRPGLRVLQLGAGLGEITRALADAGARVDAVEAAAGQARIAAARCAGCPDVRVIHDRPADWLRAAPYAGGADLVIASDDVIMSPDMLRAAADRVAPGGRLLVVSRSTLGLRHLTGPVSLAEVATRPGPLAGRERLTAALAALGFAHQVWFAVLGDGETPAVLATDDAFADPAVAAGLPLLAQQAGWSPHPALRSVSPDDALAWAIAAGLGSRLADRAVVVASRAAGPADEERRPLAWVAADPERAAAWRCTWTVAHDPDGAAILLPDPAVTATWSGPVAWRPEPVVLPPGVRGDALLTAALLRDGVAGAAVHLQAWAGALSAMVATLDAADPAGGRALDVGPAWWAVDDDGTWRASRSGLRGRFPVPIEVVAHRSLVRFLADRLLPAGLPPDLHPALDLGGAAGVLLTAAGLADAPATRTLSLDLDAELRWRTGRQVGDRAAARLAARAEHRRPVAAALATASLAWRLSSRAAPDPGPDQGLADPRQADPA